MKWYWILGFWDRVSRGTKVLLTSPLKFKGLNGNETLQPGEYYVVGFWANACGLSKKKNSISDTYIPSGLLNVFKSRKFYKLEAK